MEILDYLKLAQKAEKGPVSDNLEKIRLSIVTNFTDNLFKKILTGLCISQGYDPEIYTTPYKQYIFELKDKHSPLFNHKPELTFIFFDVNSFIRSEFTSNPDHFNEVLEDLSYFCKNISGTVVINSIINPSSTQHSRILKEHDLLLSIDVYNKKIIELLKELKNVRVLDTNLIVRGVGERNIRDLRGAYAFSQPFNNEFTLTIATEWMAFIRSQNGKIHKCIVLDLDNTLWGGVVGELGPLGVSLGHEYPGNAFMEFQRVLLDYYNHGIILAINSKNNIGDVDEIFEKNQNMILKKSHFASIVANWENKSDNLIIISKELNIGLDSMVFIDDDPLNRDLVRDQLPEVFVPDWNLPPEEYASTLLNLDVFHAIAQTQEDLERGEMYATERERKEVLLQSTDIEVYLNNLEIEIKIHLNDPAQIPRLAQLTQKTNQFNLTTIRYTEKEIESQMNSGSLIFSGDIKDRFGVYGITIMAILKKNDKKAELINFLMSCRVMGRKIEMAFFYAIIKKLNEYGCDELVSSFLPTKKNIPISNFLPQIGAKEIERDVNDNITYKLNIAEYIKNTVQNPSIKINTSGS